jgi:hypothetical protein
MHAPGLALLLATMVVPARADAADYMAELVARTFFRGLLEGQPAPLAALCAREVNFDGVRLRGAAIGERLRELAARARRKQLRLRKLEVISVAAALERYGKPPARLRRELVPGRAVALARFNVLGAAAVLARVGGFWRVIALTD